MSFWDIIWFIFIAYLFIAYIVVLFRVIDDIFRNPDYSGLAKASWIVLLIVVPFITLLIYLIAHGQDMAQRSIRHAEEAQAQQESHIKDVASTKSPAEQVTQAKALLDSGAISQAEFESMKAKALS